MMGRGGSSNHPRPSTQPITIPQRCPKLTILDERDGFCKWFKARLRFQLQLLP